MKPQQPPSPPPPRPGKLDVRRRMQRLVQSEKPFTPEAPPMRYAKPHHFAINQSREHLRSQRTFFFVAGDTPGSYSKP